MKNKFLTRQIYYDIIETSISENFQIFMETTIQFLQMRKHFLSKLQSLSRRSNGKKKQLVQRAKKNVMKFGEMYLHSDLILTKLQLLDQIVKKKKYHPPNRRRKGSINNIQEISNQSSEKQGQSEENQVMEQVKIQQGQHEKQILISDLVSWEQGSAIMNVDYFVINSDEGFLPPEADPQPKIEEEMIEEGKWKNVFFDIQ